jgi:hypothetical protein
MNLLLLLAPDEKQPGQSPSTSARPNIIEQPFGSQEELESLVAVCCEEVAGRLPSEMYPCSVTNELVFRKCIISLPLTSMAEPALDRNVKVEIGNLALHTKFENCG